LKIGLTPWRSDTLDELANPDDRAAPGKYAVLEIRPTPTHLASRVEYVLHDRLVLPEPEALKLAAVEAAVLIVIIGRRRSYLIRAWSAE
jgi:hypothetical protein